FLTRWRDEEHPESHLRYQAVMDSFARNGILQQTDKIALQEEIEPALLSIHTKKHIDMIENFYTQSHKVAAAAVAAALAGVDAVCSGEQNNVFCAVRPPGHHAMNTGREEGFCFYNNIAVAARYAQHKYKREKILIVDWDYHHGNGTESAFYEDPSVLFFSTHDYQAYPGTGDPAKIGAGKGKGYNINVHLDCNASDDDIVRSFNDELAPAVHRFKPDLVLISAGFDSRKDDLLGCFKVTDDGFARLTRIMCDIADQYCDGCVVSLLEGGYSLSGLASATVAHLRTMLEMPA
ncbi:MAG: histone deacetylase, partial [Gammaproteobacteria bacterium]|nr:histone deacetylase [Gammaproteobacteria bacterium]